MPNLLYAGLIAEGSTDYTFFQPVLEKILIECAYECTGDVDINVVEIKCFKGENFQQYVENGRKIGVSDYGLSLLIVHSDADSPSLENVLEYKFQPILDKIESDDPNELCQYISPLIPIHETEAWMLADKTLLKKIIGTDKTDSELNISGNPETFTDPKLRIEDAIRIGRQDLPKKLRNQLTISDLYSPIGQALQIDKLQDYESFIAFRASIIKILEELNLIH